MNERIWQKLSKRLGQGLLVLILAVSLLPAQGATAAGIGPGFWSLPDGLNPIPTGRYGAPAVWTGSEMIVWGGYEGNSDTNLGLRYDPATDTWAETSRIAAPEARADHSAVWTGSELIVWGGDEIAYI